MPATPPTIIAPLPSDPRVMLLAKSTGLTRREAFGVAAEAWAWMAAMAVDGIVPMTPPDSLDTLVDVTGFGQAMLEAKLVGVVDDGLVLPAELRCSQRDVAEPRRRQADDHARGDDDERRRRSDRERQRRHRKNKTLTKPATATTSTRSDDDCSARAPRRLGDVEGYAVMLLFRRDGVPFYKLTGATPTEWTGTVTDPDNPALADAFGALHATMKRKGGWTDKSDMRPTVEQLVSAAERYRAARESAAVTDDRRDEANRAFAEAAEPDDEAPDVTHVTRDCHADVTPVTRDAATVTLLSRPEGVTRSPNFSGDNDLGDVTCHARDERDTPSSSSSSCLPSEDDSKKTTTTTSSVTDAERDMDRGHDREVGILDRLLVVANPTTENRARVDPEDEAKRQRDAERWARIAEALGDDAEKVKIRYWPTLALQCRQAGIDPYTGLPVIAEGSHEPAGARRAIRATTRSSAIGKPATDIVEARGDDETRGELPVTLKATSDIGDDDAAAHAIMEQLRQGA